MTGDGMELLRRIFSAMGFDCLRRAPSSTPSSPVKLSVARATSAEGGPPSGSLGDEQSHCQSCIAFDARLERLACGHQFCDRCSDRIVNRAFRDIEGLSRYPCPVCESIRRMGLAGPELERPRDGTSLGSLREQVIEEVEEEERLADGGGEFTAGGAGVTVERPLGEVEVGTFGVNRKRTGPA